MPETKKNKKAFYLAKFNILIFILFLFILIPGYLFLIGPADGDYQKNKNSFNILDGQREQNLNLLASYQKTFSNYQDISAFDKDKINAILPDQVEEASLYVNLESLVQSIGIALDSISIEAVELEKIKKPVSAQSDDSSPEASGAVADPRENINYVNIKLELSEVSYPKLKELFSTIENNLRLLDITSYSFDPTGASLTLALKAYYNQ